MQFAYRILIRVSIFYVKIKNSSGNDSHISSRFEFVYIYYLEFGD